MIQRRLQHLTAWFCLALAVLIGLSPAQGFVVCVEDDGCVSLEIKSASADCSGCEGHDEGRVPVEASVSSSKGAPCPCIDLAVPGSTEEQFVRARSFEIYVGAWIIPSLDLDVQHVTPTVTAGRGPPACVPRVADSLAHLRSVVLLV